MIKHIKQGAVALLLAGLFCAQNVTHAETTYVVNGTITAGESYNQQDDVKRIDSYNDWFNKYTDYANGYSILFPAGMLLDVSLSKVVSVLEDQNTRVEIYYDNFAGTQADAGDYIAYSNRFLNNREDHMLSADDTLYVNGMKVHVLRWNRSKLDKVWNDRNYYVSAEFVKNHNEVYTVMIKSTQPFDSYMDILSSFTVLDRQGTAVNHKPMLKAKTKRNAETEAVYRKLFGPGSTLKFGMFEPSAPLTFRYLDELEDRLQYQFPVLLRYQNMDEYFPQRALENAYEHGRVLELTLQTVNSAEVNALWATRDEQHNARMMYDILRGKYDDYFHDYAQRMKDFGHPVIFRLNNEMNGDWCWYSAFYTGKDAELYKAVWRYVYDVFAQNGVENVIWVWNPHDVSRPDFKWNHYMMYYPGDEYVDVIGLTGYNTGTYFKGETWREFSEIYPPLYHEYTALFDKPFMITEFAANSVGGNKADWINKMFDQLPHLSNIKLAVWWSGIDYDQQGRPGRIYKLDEEEAYINIFHQRLQKFK